MKSNRMAQSMLSAVGVTWMGLIPACETQKPEASPREESRVKAEDKGKTKTKKSEKKPRTDIRESQNHCFFITNGIQEDPNDYQSIVLVWRDLGDGAYSTCTGTFVGHNAVLTAAHCLSDSQTNGGPAPELSVLIGGKNGQRVQVESIYYPKWAGSNSTYGDDLALLVLPANSAPAITPVAQKAATIGDADTILGYGQLQVGRQDTNDDLNFYRGTNRIAGIVDDYLFHVGESGTAIRSQPGVNSIAASGDSGGPLLIDNLLVGTESWGTPVLTTEIIARFQGTVSNFPNAATFQQDTNASLGLLPNLREIRQRVANGEQLGIETHINLTLPKFQTWLTNFTNQGIDIQFEEVSAIEEASSNDEISRPKDADASASCEAN